MSFKKIFPTTIESCICFYGAIITVQLTIICLFLGELRNLFEQILQCIK